MTANMYQVCIKYSIGEGNISGSGKWAGPHVYALPQGHLCFVYMFITMAIHTIGCVFVCFRMIRC